METHSRLHHSCPISRSSSPLAWLLYYTSLHPPLFTHHVVWPHTGERIWVQVLLYWVLPLWKYDRELSLIHPPNLHPHPAHSIFLFQAFTVSSLTSHKLPPAHKTASLLQDFLAEGQTLSRCLLDLYRSRLQRWMGLKFSKYSSLYICNTSSCLDEWTLSLINNKNPTHSKTEVSNLFWFTGSIQPN